MSSKFDKCVAPLSNLLVNYEVIHRSTLCLRGKEHLTFELVFAEQRCRFSIGLHHIVLFGIICPQIGLLGSFWDFVGLISILELDALLANNFVPYIRTGSLVVLLVDEIGVGCPTPGDLWHEGTGSLERLSVLVLGRFRAFVLVVEEHVWCVVVSSVLVFLGYVGQGIGFDELFGSGHHFVQFLVKCTSVEDNIIGARAFQRVCCKRTVIFFFDAMAIYRPVSDEAAV